MPNYEPEIVMDVSFRSLRESTIVNSINDESAKTKKQKYETEYLEGTQQKKFVFFFYCTKKL